MTHKLSTRMIVPAVSALVMVISAGLHAAEGEGDSEFYLKDEEFSLKEALSFRSEDKRFSLRLGGRLHADAAWFDGNDKDALNTDSSDSEIRRARLFASGKMFDDWRYRFEYDFASDHDFRIKDAWLGYSGFKSATIRAGNVQEPFSLETVTSSNNITFMERALPYAFAPDYKVGAVVNTYGDNWSAAAGVFDGNIQNGSDDGWGVAGRVTGAPVRNKGQLLHIGAAVEYREPDQVRYGSRPEAHLADRLVSTGTLRDVDSTLSTGLEAAVVLGSLSLQGEYINVAVERSNGRSDPNFDGWYAYASWFPTGEHRRYNAKKGAFSQIKPKSKYGALELAARYSEVDLEDENITGGEENDTTVGVNWYLNTNVRFMANYVWVDADPDSAGGSVDADIFEVRAQVIF